MPCVAADEAPSKLTRRISTWLFLEDLKIEAAAFRLQARDLNQETDRRAISAPPAAQRRSVFVPNGTTPERSWIEPGQRRCA
jgi:hypothetical protein